MAPVLLYRLRGGFHLVSPLKRHQGDAHAGEAGLEVRVDAEHVRLEQVLPLPLLQQQLDAWHQQGYEMALELGHGDADLGAQVFEADGVVAVEEEEDTHLVRAYVELVALPAQQGTHVGRALRDIPAE